MDTKTFAVPGISCAHCAMTIERELTALEGVERVAADLDTKAVTVERQEPATWEAISHRLTEINYPPAE